MIPTASSYNDYYYYYDHRNILRWRCTREEITASAFSEYLIPLFFPLLCAERFRREAGTVWKLLGWARFASTVGRYIAPREISICLTSIFAGLQLQLLFFHAPIRLRRWLLLLLTLLYFDAFLCLLP